MMRDVWKGKPGPPCGSYLVHGIVDFRQLLVLVRQLDQHCVLELLRLFYCLRTDGEYLELR